MTNWQRRSAKSLIKLLATFRGHALHREQVLDLLWRGVDLDPALNGLGKALHAARRAIEPELLPRQASAYLLLTDSMLALNRQHVIVDVDRFEELADKALRAREVPGYESALGAYGGELLPEDRYEDWCSERRDFVAGLRLRLLGALASALEERGALAESSDRLREVLLDDPAREDAHRRLMLLYAKMGMSDQAVRQFHLCEEALRRELDLAPKRETLSLYEDVLANRISDSGRAPQRDRGLVELRSLSEPPAEPSMDMPFVGREPIMHQLRAQLADAGKGGPGLVLINGEAGVGTTRLLREFASTAAGLGAIVLWGGGGAPPNRLAYASFGLALEGYAASCSEAERDELLRRYPALSPLVPSLGVGPAPLAADVQDRQLIAAVARLMTDLARRQPVLLVLGDLHEADPLSLALLGYLAHLAAHRPWLIVAAVREEEIEPGGDLHRLIDATTREQLGTTIDLPCLTRADCDQVVAAMLDCPVSEDLLEQIFTRSCGNPLFVRELVRDLRESRGPARGAAGRRPLAAAPAGLPPRVQSLAAMRLATIDPTARRVLELAAAADTREVSLGTLRRAAAALDPPLSSAALYDALDGALKKRLLEERKSGYAFRHPIVRCWLDESLPQHRREQFRTALNRSRFGATSELVRKSDGIPSAHAVRRRLA